jgi:vitamin B12 transporter
MTRWVSLTIALACFSSLSWRPAAAQSSPPDPSSSEEAPRKTYIGKPFIVTASRLGEPLRRALKSVTVITGDDIARQQAITIAEALRIVPGLSLQASGGTYGSHVDVRLRGADTDQMLVLIDGVQANSTWSGSFNFADMPTDNVDRIEVVRGPASALYGSEAVGGVVNIISKTGHGPLRPRVTLEGGSLGTARACASAGGGSGAFDYSLWLSRLTTDGIRANDGYSNTTFSGRVGLKPSDNKDVALSARYVDGRKSLLFDFPFAGIFDPELGYLGIETYDPNNRVENRSLDLSLRFVHRVSGRWDYSATLGQSNGTLINRNSADPDPTFTSRRSGVTVPYTPGVLSTTLDVRRSIVETQHNLSYLPWGTTSVGVEGELEEADRTDFSNLSNPWEPPVYTAVRADRTNVAYFAQQRFHAGPPASVPAWKEAREDGFLRRLARRLELDGSVTVGARLDDNSQFGSELSPKLAAGVDIGRTGTSVAALWSEGFNAPSLTDLYFPGYSNPYLKPELSSTTEFTLRQELFGHTDRGRLKGAIHKAVKAVERLARGEDAELELGSVNSGGFGATLEASYFNTDYQDLIALEAVYDTLGQYMFSKPVNVAIAQIEGFETSIRADLHENAGAVFTYTRLEAVKREREGAEEERMPRRPRNLFNMALWAEPLRGLSARLDLNTTSSVEDGFNFIGADGVIRFGDRAGFTRVGMALSYAITSKYKAHVKIDNLLNESYEEVKGYPAPGRTFLAGVTLSM